MPATSKLTATSLTHDVLPSVRASTHIDALASAVLRLCDENPIIQSEAIGDCFAIGRGDARVMLLVRNCLRTFRDEAVGSAIVALAHAASHPDILFHAENHVPARVAELMKAAFLWTPDDLITLFRAAPWSVGWDRGSLGQCLYHLLIVDPDYEVKVRSVIRPLAQVDLDAAFAALYLTLYWSNKPRETFESIMSEIPRVGEHELIGQVGSALAEFGFVSL